MEKVSKSLEILKVLASSSSELVNSSNEKSKFDPISLTKEKIHHLNVIADLLSSSAPIRVNNENYFKLLTAGVEALFTSCDENDSDVRLAAEENINRLVKNLKETQLARMQVELHRIIKRNPNIGGRALKGALWRFAELAPYIHPKKIRPFFEHLFPAFCSIATRTEEIVHDKLPDYYELIFRTLGRSINDKEVKDLLAAYLANMSNESALIRRSSAACLIVICRHCRYPMAIARILMTYAIDKLIEYHNQTENNRILNGLLGLIKNLVQLLGIYIQEFLSSSLIVQQPMNTSKNPDFNEQYHPINIRHIIECVDMVAFLCFQHADHNVVSSSLETLEIIFKYSNLFDFDQFLLVGDNGSVAESRVSQILRKIHPTYQRSFIENIEQQNNEMDSSVDKRTSAARLVEQLTSKYILNTDGTVKSDDESRVSIKSGTLACLAHLATIDPFAFFDSFDYPAEIITYLLCLRDHGDPHLRGACSHLLGNLIQTTIRLLTSSPPIGSLSTSFTSSFLNQCSLLLTDSQDSTRPDIQLGILAELLSAFRSCLNDVNARVIHVTLNALRTLLPVLLMNSHALTTIALELLEDAVQHSSTSYVLAKVALAQLIGAIDFRILTYVEQQQSKLTTRSWLDRCVDIILRFLADDDTRVRQVAALTFAKFVDQSSFVPCQWPIHSLLKWLHSSCQWIYDVHHRIQFQPAQSSFHLSSDETRRETISCLSSAIFDRLCQASTRVQIIGCLEGIYALSTVLTSNTIGAFFHQTFDELRLLVHFFKHPFILHDLNNLQLLLDILDVLFSNLSNQTGTTILTDIQSTEKVFHFLIRLLSIFACVVEDTTPPTPPASKISFPQIPSSPQQLKKRFETNTNKDDSSNKLDKDSTNDTTSSKDSLLVNSTNGTDKEKKTNRTQLGAFGNNPSMMKLFELIRTSYHIHKNILSASESDRFAQLIFTTLSCLRSSLNLVSMSDISKHMEETLNYLKSTFILDKTGTILCTQELLQTLHNLTATVPVSVETSSSSQQSSSINSLTNIHTIVIRQPMIYLFGSRHPTSNDQPNETTAILDLYLTRKQRKTIDHLKRPPNRAERTKIGNYIRLFETVVILGLKKYVNSNETDFQAAVLDLLVQLLLLRVNYSLLDADEHFLNHILNQLEMIEETMSGIGAPPHFIHRIAEFLVMLSHDSLHSKQVIKVQDLIKHCDLLLASGHEPESHALSALEPVVHDLFLIRLKSDNKELEAQRMVIVQTLLKLVRYNKALQLLTVILDSVRNEGDKWKRLSRQIVDILLVHLQSNITVTSSSKTYATTLDIYATQLTLFDVVSSVALRPIDPFVTAFRTLTNRNDMDRYSTSRWLMNINLVLRCLIQHSNEDAILPRWKDTLTNVEMGRDESFSAVLLRIVHDVTLRILTNIRQSRGIPDLILISLLSDYLYLILHIIENPKQFRTIVHGLRQLLIHDSSNDETLLRLDSFSYLTVLTDYFKSLSFYSIPLLLQWTHLLNILDFIQEPWWTSMLSIPTPSSLITHLSISGQLQSYCDLICRHELYVEHLTSIVTHRHLLIILFEQSDTCSYVHNLFGLIHRTSPASHLFIEAIYANWEHLIKHNHLLLPLKILRTLEPIHLDQSGLLLLLLIEQFLILPYRAILRLAELIVCRRIEMMLTLDQQALIEQLLPKHLPLILQALSPSIGQKQQQRDIKSNERLAALMQRMIAKIDYIPPLTIESSTTSDEMKMSSNTDEDFVLNWIRKLDCPAEITPKMYAQMLKTVAYKKLLPFMMSPDFVWTSMSYCLQLGMDSPSLWRASTSALVKKINDLCFSLPSQRLIPSELHLNDDDSTPDSLYMKSLIGSVDRQVCLVALTDALRVYFETIQTRSDLVCQVSSGDSRDLLRFLVFVAETIYIKLLQRPSFITWDLVNAFFSCLIATINNTTSMIYTLLSGPDQIVSCCTLLKTIVAIFDYLHRRACLNKSKPSTPRHYAESIEFDSRPATQMLLSAFNQLDRLYHYTRQMFSIPHFSRRHLRTIAILIFRLPIFHAFIRIPSQFWEQNNETINKLQFGMGDYCLSSFPVELLQHSDVMLDYVERISFVGWLSRTQFQEIWVTFLAAINPPTIGISLADQKTTGDDEHTTTANGPSKEEILEGNATQCVWVRGVTTFLLNALRLNCTGNPADMTFEHRCRNKSIPFLLTDIGGQYIQTRSTLETSSSDLFTNVERLTTHDALSYGQLSFDTLLTSIQSSNAAPLPTNNFFDRLFSRNGLDLTSCLQILLELYVRWLSNSNTICLQLKYELVRSFVLLADLFTSSQQLSSLFDLCDDLVRTWFDEDDLLTSFVTYGLAKSGVLLGQTQKESNEVYVRLIERAFKVTSKTSAYASSLVLLESHEDDINKLIIPILIQELRNEILNNNFKTNLDIRVNGFCLASLFYLIENGNNNCHDLISFLLKDETIDTWDQLTRSMISIGFERLLLNGQYPKGDIWRLFKRNMIALRQTTWSNVDHLVLLLARIYTSLQTNNDIIGSNEASNEEQEMIDGTVVSSSSDNIVMELVGELYERTKQPHTLPHEAVLLLTPLPALLAHVGLSDRLMNKMVCEFAATAQQLYPQVLAHTVFAVFRSLITSHYSAKVNEWTLLSMTSVAQRKPIRLAIWGLTCLMFSACPSHTTANSMFPLALSRFSARFEELDNRLFLLAGREYYSQLSNIEQRHQFEQAFATEPNTDTPYAELIAHIRTTVSSTS